MTVVSKRRSYKFPCNTLAAYLSLRKCHFRSSVTLLLSLHHHTVVVMFSKHCWYRSFVVLTIQWSESMIYICFQLSMLVSLLPSTYSFARSVKYVYYCWRSSCVYTMYISLLYDSNCMIIPISLCFDYQRITSLLAAISVFIIVKNWMQMCCFWIQVCVYAWKYVEFRSAHWHVYFWSTLLIFDRKEGEGSVARYRSPRICSQHVRRVCCVFSQHCCCCHMVPSICFCLLKFFIARRWRKLVLHGATRAYVFSQVYNVYSCV